MSDLETAKLSAAPSVDSAVTPISSITMKVPSTTIGNNSLPQISVGQVLAGDTVYLTTDALCSTTPIGSTTATSSGILDISTLTPLVDGTYRIYAFRKNSENQTSACSSVYVDYILDTVAPDVSIASLNNLDHTISSTQTPLIEVLNATDVASGIDHYDLSIGTTMGGQDILAWSNVENSSILSKINIL